MDVLRRLGLLCVNVCGEKIFILAEQDHVRSTGTCSRRPSIVNNPSASLTPSTARMSAASTSCCTASSRLPRLGLVVLRLTLHPWDFWLQMRTPHCSSIIMAWTPSTSCCTSTTLFSLPLRQVCFVASSTHCTMNSQSRTSVPYTSFSVSPSSAHQPRSSCPSASTQRTSLPAPV